MKIFNLNLEYRKTDDCWLIKHQKNIKRVRIASYFILTTMCFSLLSVFAGCQAAEEELPIIKTWQVDAPTVQALVSQAENVATTEEEPDADGVEFLGIGFAADGSYIMISFTAPPAIAENWWEGSIYVIDEKTGDVYNEIPVMPKIGPLIGKPQQTGQVGYAMLINHNFGIQSGCIVTVVIGNYKRVHVQI